MICPSCQQNVSVSEKHHGALYTCENCQAVYFINFDGQPEYSDVPAEAPVEETLQENITEEPTEDFSASLEPLVDTINVVSVDSPVDSPVENSLEQEFLGNSEPEPENDNSTFSDIAQEISDFGNAEVQLASLNYDLLVSGLDSQETMRLFKEAVEDSRFGWDAAELLQNVKNGQIKFERLSPVKAYILAKRLQFLDIEKQWGQNVLS